MNTHVKYLEELIAAIKSEGLKNRNSNGFLEHFPPCGPLEDDIKSLKVMKILIRNLVNTNVSGQIFGKTLVSFDLLIKEKSYLLTSKLEGQLGIIWIFNQFLEIALQNFDKKKYLWLLNRKICNWCQICIDCYGFSWQKIIEDYIFKSMNNLEYELTIALSSKIELKDFLKMMSKLIIQMELCLYDDFAPILSLFFNTSKWDFHFQRLIRIVFYIIDSIVICEELLCMKERLLTILSTYSINYRFPSYNKLKFGLDLIQNYLNTNLSGGDSISVNKLLLRMYHTCITQTLLFQMFRSIFNLDKWVLSKKEVSDLLRKTIYIIYFDIKRRSKSELTWDNVFKTWIPNDAEFENYREILLIPYTESKQLEKLRKCILFLFNKSDEIVLFSELGDSLTIFHKDSSNSIDLGEVFLKLESLISYGFQKNDTFYLVKTLKLLGKMSCLESRNEKYEDICALCDTTANKLPLNIINLDRLDASTNSTAFKILIYYYVRNKNVEEISETLLLGIILALYRIFSHFQPPKLILDDNNNITDHMGIFNLFQKAYTSKSRILRLLSIRLLPLWNISSLHNSEDQNTVILIKFLQIHNKRFMVESRCMAWLQITLSTTGELFDTLLLKLIDIFNSSDFAESVIMCSQLKHLALVQDKTPYQLLSPVLPILLKQYGKSLTVKKSAFERLVSLVQYPAKTILENFQRYIVPYAVMQYKADVIGEIANIMCDNDPTLLLEQKQRLLDKNSRQIFAVSLVKHRFFSLDTIETLFYNTVPTFDKGYVASYLPDYKTLAEVLKLFQSVDEMSESMPDNEKLVLLSLRYLLTHFNKDKRRTPKLKNIDDWTQDQEVLFQKKLQDNILGIFQIFSSDIHDAEGKTTYYEKLRVINGITFLLKHASKESIISALPQVSICLQSGLEISPIQISTLKSWMLLIKILTDEELSAVIDGLVCFLLQQWNSFDLKVRSLVSEVIDHLVENKSKLILTSRPHILMSLMNRSDLRVLERHGVFARSVKKVLPSIDWLSVFAHNLKSNNIYVVRQILDDIGSYLAKRQYENINYSSRKYNFKDLTLILGALLDTSHKFRNTDLNICQQCVLCISFIGVLDAAESKFQRTNKDIDDICDFNNEAQTIKFLINIINDKLVPSFWQSENPSKQLFVALVIQESLKYCGLSSSSWDISKPDLFPSELKLWNRFNDISKTTLYPLRSSLYIAQSWKEYIPLTYPSFKVKEGYTVWIKNLTLDLLKTATEEKHPLHVFSSLIREDDGSLSSFLLPYIVIDIIVKAEDNTPYVNFLSNITNEFSFIFNYDLYELNHFQIDSLKMCYDSIFKVFEYCKKWSNYFKQEYNRCNGSFSIKEEKYMRMLARVDAFVNSVPSSLLAQKSLETNSFERSALYLEKAFRETGVDSVGESNFLVYLQTTYAGIGDVDAIDGTLKVFSNGNLTSKIEELQYSDNWKMAQNCFEALSDVSENENRSCASSSVNTTKMLKIMQSHQLYKRSLMKLEMLVPEEQRHLDDKMDEWYSMGIEAATLLGNVSSLKNWIKKIEYLEKLNNPNVLLYYNMSKVLLAAHDNELPKLRIYMNRCFRLIGTHFITPSANTTMLKRRKVLMRLHALQDINILANSNTEVQLHHGLSILDARMTNVGSDFEPNYYLLSIRKSYDAMRPGNFTKSDLSNTCFRISQLSRTNLRLDLASDSLMYAFKYEHPSAELEYADLLWDKGEKEMALKVVSDIDTKYNTDNSVNPRSRAKVLLKYTEWLDLSNNSVSEQIIRQYTELIKIDTEWDASYYSLGLFYSRLLEKKKLEGFTTDGRIEYKAITYFLLAFEKSPRKVRETLPKVITFWLDTTTLPIIETSISKKNSIKKVADDICQRIELAIKNCPTHIWYSVLTQLLSRLLHQHVISAKLIIHILLNLTVKYSSVMLWYISVLLNSESKRRVETGRQIIEKYHNYSKNSTKLINSSLHLVQCLTNVCIKDVKQSTSRSGRLLEKDFNFDMSLAPSEMAVPVNINFQSVSPSSEDCLTRLSGETVTISKFGSYYKVFSSLKRPKKINIIGSDGNIYGIMCKKEDVRQDNQYMQFANTMSFLLGKDIDSTKRHLNITTYAVLSLREDCGLLEIVPNVTTLRSILVTKYDSMKIKYNLKALHNRWQNLGTDEKIKFFDECIEKFPPVLYQWFLESFPDPIVWYTSHKTFVTSYAVMSMVGHILGLGDRHCENILLDVKTGKVLHVDFDCLFEKGKKLPIPEIVPFRLTHNILDAFGITKTEGAFKKSSQVTVNVMRTNEIALVNIIETIMYDRNMDHSIQKALKVLRNKIRGIDPRDGLALSVPGQVETVIQQAFSKENLSQMYIGWLPFW